MYAGNAGQFGPDGNPYQNPQFRYQNGNHMNYAGQNGYEFNGYNQQQQAPPPPPQHQNQGPPPHQNGYPSPHGPPPYGSGVGHGGGYPQYPPQQHYQGHYMQRSYGNMNGGHYQNGGQMGPPSVQYGGHHNGHSGYHGHNNGYPGPAGDYAVQKWNNMASFNNMKAVDWDKVTNLIQIVKNFYTEALSVSARTTEEVTDWRKKNSVRVVGTANMKPILTFEEACIPPYLMNIIRQQHYEAPTVIQSQSWPIALSGCDMVGIARTGSGKTLAFCLPAIVHIMAQPDLRSGDGPVALILSPTRELAKQVEEVARLYGKTCHINSVAVYGGADKNSQISLLNKGAHIVVACPGRLLDLINQKKLNLHRTTYVVMDEADRMLDMGFEPQIRKVVGQIRKDRQTLMFSATWPTSVQKLANDFMNDPTQIYIGNEGLAVNSNIKQIIDVITENEKQEKFMTFFHESIQKGHKILVFTDTKRECDNLAYVLNKQRHRSCAAIHGDKDQRERERVLNDFRNGRVSTLIATDVAARGLDIDDVGFVINYDFPHTVEDYVHRIGRTGRANQTGTAYSLITEKHSKCVNDLIKVLEESGSEVPEALIRMKPNDRRRNGYNGRGRQNNRYGGHSRQYDNGYRGQRNSGPRMNGYSNNMGSRNGGTGGLRGGRGGGPGPGLQNNLKRNNQPSNNAPFQPWNGPPTNQFNNMKIS